MTSPTVTSLAKDLAKLTERVTALEEFHGRHEGRIQAIEAQLGVAAPWRPGDQR